MCLVVGATKYFFGALYKNSDGKLFGGKKRRKEMIITRRIIRKSRRRKKRRRRRKKRDHAPLLKL